MDRTPNIILKEQLQLVHAQKEIDKMIQIINGCLNELLVENLQLKSNDITNIVNGTDSKVETMASVLEENEVNKQSLNLGVVKTVKSEYMEEEDEEEDDDEISSLSFLG